MSFKKPKEAKARVKRRMDTQRAVDTRVKEICNIMRRGNCAGAMQYVPELTWILFLRILDEKEQREEQEAKALDVDFEPSVVAPFRWRDWGAPSDASPKGESNKRQELENAPQGAFFDFVNASLLPYLKALKTKAGASARQKVISEIMSGVERVRIDTERNFLDVLDKVQTLTSEAVDPTHVFTLSQVYEGLLLKMGEKGNDGGQFFTPRQVIKTMVQVIDPQLDETVYDPGCGTGGFLAQSFEYVHGKLPRESTAQQLRTLKEDTFWGREKENLVYPMALANLIIHGIDKPNIWHGNTLTGQEIYGGLFEGAPSAFDVILTNPPFGGKEGKEAQTNFDYKTSSTQVLFLQHIMRNLGGNGRCGIILDDGLLFRTTEEAFVRTKRKLLDDCDVWCIVSLPAGVFSTAGAGVKTNILFFTKGKPTRRIWYYDLTDVKVRKKKPLALSDFGEFLALLPARADGPLSWTVDIEARKRAAHEEAEPFRAEATKLSQAVAQKTEALKALRRLNAEDPSIIDIEAEIAELTRRSRERLARAREIADGVYDMKAVNPNKKAIVDDRTPEDLLRIIDEQGHEVAEILSSLRETVLA